MLPRSLKHEWREVLRGTPGRRFRDRYHRACQAGRPGGALRRIGRIVAAALAIVVAFVLMFIPGPAIPFFLFAGALLATESLQVARLMDWLELRVRACWRWGDRQWRRLPRYGRVAVTVLVVSVTLGTTVLVYRLWRG
jgi:hypothetical protein